MLVTLQSNLRTQGVVHKPGEVIDLDETLAEQLIADGMATEGGEAANAAAPLAPSPADSEVDNTPPTPVEQPEVVAEPQPEAPAPQEPEVQAAPGQPSPSDIAATIDSIQ